VAPDGTLESDINLDIALRLEALAAFWGVETVMTRSTAEIDYPAEAESLAAMKRADQNARIALINETPGAVLFSIHQNNYPASSPWGIQVFYGAVTDSSVLAETLQENLTGQLCPDNRRVAEPIDEGIYLMRKAQCQSVLVECGFLSNPSDLEKLESDGYRTQLAAVMLASYLQYTRGTAL
jgi:N-acetylmuramoyl-L-alanine amidase